MRTSSLLLLSLFTLVFACGGVTSPESAASTTDAAGNDAATADARSDACAPSPPPYATTTDPYRDCVCPGIIERATKAYQEALHDPKNLACTVDADCTNADAYVCGGYGRVIVNTRFLTDPRTAVPVDGAGEVCIRDCGSGGGRWPENVHCGPAGTCIGTEFP